MLRSFTKTGLALSRPDGVVGPFLSLKSKYASVAAATGNLSLKSYDEIPGPRTWPLFGSMLSAKEFGGKYEMTNMSQFLDDLNRDYGDVVRWRRFNLREVFTFNPEHVKTLIASEDSWPFRPIVWPWEIYAKRNNFPSALINSQGEFWKAQRSATNPIMARPQRVVSYLSAQNGIVDEFIQIVKNEFNNGAQSQPIVMKKFQDRLKFLNLELMGLVAFDRRLNALNDSRPKVYSDLVADIEEYTILSCQLLFSAPIWMYISTKKWKEFELVSHRIFAFIREVAQQEYDKLNSKQQTLDDSEDRTMLQQFLINKKKSNLDMTIIVSVMSELLLAAFDTTSINLHNLLYELGKNPEVQEEIYQEIMKCYPNDTSSNLVTEETLSKLKLLKASLKESQRLHPLAAANARITSKDMVFDNYLIPAGTQVSTCFETMGKSERLFKDPKSFNPKRWTSEKEDANKLLAYSSMPFGFGARMCIGRRLAEQVMFTFMTKFMKNFKVEYVGKDFKTVFRLVNAPDQDLDLKITPRN